MFEPEKKLRKTVMGIKTDSLGVDDPKDPDSCNVYKLFSLFANDSQKSDLAARYRKGGLGYGTAKQELFELLLETFKGPREEREKLQNDLGHVKAVLKAGAKKARSIAEATIQEVRELTGLI